MTQNTNCVWPLNQAGGGGAKVEGRRRRRDTRCCGRAFRGRRRAPGSQSRIDALDAKRQVSGDHAEDHAGDARAHDLDDERRAERLEQEGRRVDSCAEKRGGPESDVAA